jgi:hypothetical protein
MTNSKRCSFFRLFLIRGLYLYSCIETSYFHGTVATRRHVDQHYRHIYRVDQKKCTIFTHQYKGAVCIHFLGHSVYRVSQEERSIFWKVIVSVILSKKLYMNMCPIPNGFRDLAWAPSIVLPYRPAAGRKVNILGDTSCPHTSCKVH